VLNHSPGSIRAQWETLFVKGAACVGSCGLQLPHQMHQMACSLHNADFWLPPQHDINQPDTWECHRLAAFSELHQQFCSEYKFNEWAPPADEVPDQVAPRIIAPTLPPLNLLATLQVHPWEDNDNATKRPEIPLQRHITTWIMKHLFSDPPDAPTTRMGQMQRLHQAQSILNVGPTRDADPRDYSILRNDMPHREHVDAPEK
jgi:hypothetical protein